MEMRERIADWADANPIKTVAIIFMIVAILFLGFITVVSYSGTPTEGTHVGYVTAVEKSGIIWPTHTVYIKTDLESTQEDTYCVTNDFLVHHLKKDAKERNKIELHFERDRFLIPPWECAGESAIATSRIVIW